MSGTWPCTQNDLVKWWLTIFAQCSRNSNGNVHSAKSIRVLPSGFEGRFDERNFHNSSLEPIRQQIQDTQRRRIERFDERDFHNSRLEPIRQQIQETQRMRIEKTTELFRREGERVIILDRICSEKLKWVAAGISSLLRKFSLRRSAS